MDQFEICSRFAGAKLFVGARVPALPSKLSEERHKSPGASEEGRNPFKGFGLLELATMWRIGGF